MGVTPSTLAACVIALEKKEISCKELIQENLKTIKKYDDKINAIVYIDQDYALKQAEEADILREKGDKRPLLGIPIIHKDIFVNKNMPTTCCSKILENYRSPYDATVVARSNLAGMCAIGSSNMDEFAMGSSNETSCYGPVRNPWNVNKVPGGSSGGSAAAVAAGYCYVASGSDTGGSIRQPASFCGITGLKPTYGRVSRYGMIAYCSSLDQAGPLTRSAEDAAIILNIWQGRDGHDATLPDKNKEDFTKNLNNSIKGLRIGVPKQFFDLLSDKDIAKRIEDAIYVYKSLGCEIIEIDLPSLLYSISTYYVLAPAEAASNLARYDGIRYGYRAKEIESLEDLYLRTRHDGFGMEVKRRIILGNFVLSSGLESAVYQKALKAKNYIQNQMQKSFEEVDVILGPTSPSVAFDVGQKTNDPVAMYQSDIFTIGANLAGLPAISIPTELHNGLPVGLHLIANKWKESLLLNVAHQFQLNTNWHLLLPQFEGFDE